MRCYTKMLCRTKNAYGYFYLSNALFIYNFNITFFIKMALTEERYQRFPITEDTYCHENTDWVIVYKSSHILSSKCTGRENECDAESSLKCQFCHYNNILQLPHLPDMVFPSNSLTITYNNNQCSIEFNPLDSLARVSNGKMSITVACSDEWKESRSETGCTETVLKPFDWTFNTDYMGTLKGDWCLEETTEKINVEKLMKKDKIVCYHELTLFEDELHDNGIAQLSVKIRVMPEVFFVLLRYFLRVDNVVVQINDTRYYHEFNTDYVLREYTSKEAKIPDLKTPASFLLDPNIIAQHLPETKKTTHKLILPKKEK